MSRIAVIADIHANPLALEAVVEDLSEQRVDEVLVGGDLVGRGPCGGAVVDRVEELGWRSARGNHEDYLLSFRRRDVPEAWLVTEQWAASRWMAAELEPRHVEYIDELPFSLRSKTAPSLQLFHGSPRSYNEGIGPWTSRESLNEYLDEIDGSLMVCAHTHRPLLRELDDGLVVNVGSVGLPFNGDWRAQYAIFVHEEDGDWDVEFRQVEYPRDDFLSRYESSGFLREGGVTAVLLKKEVEFARPFLVPFLKWAEIENVEPAMVHLDDFLDMYDPEESMATFFSRFDDES